LLGQLQLVEPIAASGILWQNPRTNRTIVWYKYTIMSVLAEILSSRTRAEIFRLLFGLGGLELHLREIVRRSGLSVGTVRGELRRLERLDLVVSRRDGNRLYYRANPRHPLYGDIRALVLKTSGLADVLRPRLETEKIEVAFVFGSVAEGREKAGSDVDLFIIGEIGLRAASGRLSGAAEQLGREVNPVVMRPEEFLRRRKRRDHFLAGVLASPKLFLVGSADELDAMGGERLASAPAVERFGGPGTPGGHRA